MTPADLLAEPRRTRIRAIRDLPVTVELPYTLRRTLFTDRDAEVRGTAARRLGELDHAAIAGWLGDALGDHSPLVRDSVLRGIAKQGPAAVDGRDLRPAGSTAGWRCGLIDATRTCDLVATLTRDERIWWVRRTAIYTLAAIAPSEVATFKAALADPFWRVRQAAVRVLAVLGARDLDVREDIIAAPPSSTLAYLRASWGPALVEAPVRATSTNSLLPAALLDPDPAVVTARLATATDTSPLALVEMLCDPHAPLRLLAAERVAGSGDLAALDASLDWLEEPRIPHVAETVEHMLDSLGDPAAELAARAIGRVDRRGAARWAIAWVVATRSETLYDVVLERATRDPTLRRGALKLASDDELVAWSEGTLVDPIAIELHERGAYEALSMLDTAAHPAARALQVDLAARHDGWERVVAAQHDPHHGPRAVATRWLVRSRRIDGVAALADLDPAVREAAVTAELAPRLLDDLDPWVARAAAARLAATWRGQAVVPPEVTEAGLHALSSVDPWIRAQACQLPLHDDRVLAVAIERLADPEEMVRSAALDALEHGSLVDARLAKLPGDLPELARRMIHAWLHGEALAVTTVDQTAPAGDQTAPPFGGAAGRAQVPAGEVIDRLLVESEASSPAPAPTVERRHFGRAGFSVAPLAISGAFDLSPASLYAAADAGVDLWFWEPAYESLSRFLRTRPHRSHVIAGSYHADAASIEADVDRALRRLRRDALDVFLLFWSRSSARVDADAFAIVERLKRSGKVRAVGFSTHHRELARTAIETSPWDVVMIRHSAAHPGIETELLPTARAQGTAIITFSALCYGRMLSGPNAPSPADCYRYSLSQPGVTACISAPRRRRELLANLSVLGAPTLPTLRQAELRTHGIGVRTENQRFNTLLRQPTRDAAAAARELLATELPPTDEIQHRPLPRTSTSRGARTNLGKTRRTR